MQLAQAEAVGMVDDERVGVGDIKAGLDDGGAHEHVDVAVPEVAGSRRRAVARPSCRGLCRHAASGTSSWIFAATGGDVLHTVVHVEHLPTTQQLAPDGGADLGVRRRHRRR